MKLELTADEAAIVARAFYIMSGETALEPDEEDVMNKVLAFVEVESSIDPVLGV